MRHIFTVRSADDSAVSTTIEITDAEAAGSQEMADKLRGLAAHYRDRTLAI